MPINGENSRKTRKKFAKISSEKSGENREKVPVRLFLGCSVENHSDKTDKRALCLKKQIFNFF